MRREQITKVSVRRRPRDVELQPLAPAAAPDLSDADELLGMIDEVLAAA